MIGGKSNEGSIEILARKRQALRMERERNLALQAARAQADTKIRSEALAEIRSQAVELLQFKARVDENNSKLITDLDLLIQEVRVFREQQTSSQIDLENERRIFFDQAKLIRQQTRQFIFEREQDRMNMSRAQV
jgi:uncharacterized protein YqfA (UPF0365 family)